MTVRLTILFLIPLFLPAQPENHQLGGYVKYLYSNSEDPLFGRMNDHILHARINAAFFLTEEITAAAALRNRIIAGESVQRRPGFSSTIRPDHDFGNGDIFWWESRSSVFHSELDRLSVEASYGNTRLTLGRQRIAWGTALVWNPTDLFNPLSILDVDYEERPGVDALRGEYFLSEVSTIEIAARPGKNSARRILAAKILLNRWKYDLHFLGGMHGNDPFFGGSWAGDIAGAGFRGEIASKKISSDVRSLFPAITARWTTSAVLSADYTFTDNTYLHTEFLFNDRGSSRQASAALPAASALGLLSPARWSVFQELSFDAHPLVRVSGFIIYNPLDRSSVFVPSLQWSVLENFDVSFVGLLFSGDPLTEYGGYGRSLLLRGKYSL